MPVQSNVLWFKDIRMADVPRVGGKNASLGELYSTLASEGVKVPNGFALTASAYAKHSPTREAGHGCTHYWMGSSRRTRGLSLLLAGKRAISSMLRPARRSSAPPSRRHLRRGARELPGNRALPDDAWHRFHQREPFEPAAHVQDSGRSRSVARKKAEDCLRRRRERPPRLTARRLRSCSGASCAVC